MEDIPSRILKWPNPLILGLSGAGLSPAIFKELHDSHIPIYGIDWGNWPPPWTIDGFAMRLSEVLDQREGPTLLAGVSLGGAIAIRTAALKPKSLSGLIISNTGACITRHGDLNLPQRVKTNWTQKVSDDFLLSCFKHKPPTELWNNLQQY